MKVSIIVPVYNTQDYLKKCLDSLVNQTYNNIEIILINDGSPDNSEKIILKYKEKYPKLIKYYKQKNKGQGAARNLGIKKASGDYITFVDSDDYVDINMIEEMINQKGDIIICDILKEENDKQIYFNNYWNVKEDASKNYMTSHMGPVARLYKASLFKDNNIYFKEGVIYEDLATVPLLGLHTKNIKYINKAFYHYVIRRGSSMKQIKYNKVLENIFEVMGYLNSAIPDEYHEELEYLYIEHLLYSASLRFLKFNRKDKMLIIRNIIKEKYPHYKNNIYYKNKSIKFKVVCSLIYHKIYLPLRLVGGK